MIKHIDIDDADLHQKIKRKEVVYGGNLNLKIYGTLQCKSGKRIKKENRVFFNRIEQAKKLGFRPCGHCLSADYKIWKTDLFNDTPNPNILPFDGEVKYYGRIINNKNTKHYFDQLLNNIQWKNDKAIIFGKLIITKREVAWYGDKPFDYTYSKTTKSALPWTKELLELKEIIENKTGEKFNSCLLNLYHNGDEGMAWHSDGEKDLKKNGAIGSLSFGAERKFSFKHKETKQTVSVHLEKGSLLVMKGKTQANWLHRLPPTKKAKSQRINLTFRTIVI